MRHLRKTYLTTEQRATRERFRALVCRLACRVAVRRAENAAEMARRLAR
jgi:hypothetical protein